MLIEASSEIAYPLLLLFKKSLHETSVPADWKSANVTPIFKKGLEVQWRITDLLALPV